MDNTAIIRRYFERFFNGRAVHSAVRGMLTDDFVFRGPLMQADGADDYVTQLIELGDELELYAHVRELVAAGDKVAALVDFQGPNGPLAYAQWFTLREEKIVRIEVIYDPRPFLEGAGTEGG